MSVIHSITSDLLYRILKVLDPYAIFYAFYDKFIPRRYNSVEDSYFISNNITYNFGGRTLWITMTAV